VLFRLRTGKRVHEGANAIEIVTKMAKVPAPRIRDVDPSVSEGFAKIVDRAIQFVRDDRYQNAAEMRADIRALLEVLAPSTVVERPEPPRRFGLSLLLVVPILVAAVWVVRAGVLPGVKHDTPAASTSAPVNDSALPDTFDATAEEDAEDAAALAVVVEDDAGDASTDAEEEEDEEEDEDATVDAGEDAMDDATDDAMDDADAASDIGAAGKALNELLTAPTATQKKATTPPPAPKPTATKKAAPKPSTAKPTTKKKRRKKKK
jgi:hypothetical protein